MAITHIHQITRTLEKSITYCMADKIGKIGLVDTENIIFYDHNPESDLAHFYTLNSVQNCKNYNEPIKSFKEHIESKRGALRKEKPRTKNGKEVLAWHLVQSFEKGTSPTIAHQIGTKLANDVFRHFPVTISTHTNTENVHNHLIVCAWNFEGRKWNNCNKNYRLIRETSDKLCNEYGLHVLENTKREKLIERKDKFGNIHFYEPTDRKNNLLKKRANGEMQNYDLQSYANTAKYTKLLSNRELVKKDIDKLLPVANSYEHLLTMLRDIGYTIKDKKNNGQWRQYVSFTVPMAQRAVRDIQISADGFYLRENLEKYITQRLSELNRTGHEKIKKDITEDIKKKVKELYGFYDTKVLNELLEKQVNKNKRVTKKIMKQEILVQRIQQSFRCLRFVEQREFYSYKQIILMAESILNKYNQCMLILLDLKNQLEKNKTSTRQCTGLNTDELEKLTNSIVDLELRLGKYKIEIDRYDECIHTLDRICKENNDLSGRLIAEYKEAKNAKIYTYKNVES